MTKRKTKDTDITLQMPVAKKPKFVFRASGNVPYEEEIHSGMIQNPSDLNKIMAEGISQYCTDTENLRLPWHETWQLLKDGKVVMSFSRADLEDKDRFWAFVQVIRSHGCMIFEIRNDY